MLFYTLSLYVDNKWDGYNNIEQVVIFMLVYVILNVGKEYFKKDRIRKLLLVASIFELAIAVSYSNVSFIFFIPLNVFELLEDKINPIIIITLTGLSALVTDKAIDTEYALIALFSMLIYNLAFRNDKKLLMLSENYSQLKERNYDLRLKVDEDNKYKEQLKYTSQIEERNKIAQVIHDKLGHSISGSIMQLEAAKLLISKDKEKSEAIIQNTIMVLRGGMEDIRITLKNIKPPAQQLGINKIKLLVEEFNKDNNINASLFYNGDIEKISFEQWKVIYENIYEALTNSIKYSNARNIKVKLEVLNKLIKAEIKDDGKGCDKIVKNIGLSGIEERSANVNGKVIIDGSDGFSVITLLPLIGD
jgi:signal transduction histidine kinase